MCGGGAGEPAQWVKCFLHKCEAAFRSPDPEEKNETWSHTVGTPVPRRQQNRSVGSLAMYQPSLLRNIRQAISKEEGQLRLTSGPGWEWGEGCCLP